MDLPGARRAARRPGQSADRLVDAAGDLRGLSILVEVVNAQRFEVISGGELRRKFAASASRSSAHGPARRLPALTIHVLRRLILPPAGSGQEYPRLGHVSARSAEVRTLAGRIVVRPPVPVGSLHQEVTDGNTLRFIGTAWIKREARGVPAPRFAYFWLMLSSAGARPPSFDGYAAPDSDLVTVVQVHPDAESMPTYMAVGKEALPAAAYAEYRSLTAPSQVTARWWSCRRWPPLPRWTLTRTRRSSFAAPPPALMS